MLEIRNLIKIYVSRYNSGTQRIVALNGINLIAKPGKITALIGDSGSGKTTLIKVIAGLLKPSAGEVLVNNKIHVHQLSGKQLEKYRTKYIGYLSQRPSENIPFETYTLRELLELPLILEGVGKQERDVRVKDLLAKVDLQGLSDRVVKVLSGGEAQRLAVLMSIIKKPQIFLADEPTGELDEENAKKLFKLMKELTEEYDCTTIIVSHDPMILNFCDKAYRLRNGVIQSIIEPKKKFSGKGEMEDYFMSEDFDYLFLDNYGRVAIPHKLIQEIDFSSKIYLKRLKKGLILSSDSNYLEKLAIKEVRKQANQQSKKGEK